VQKNEIEVIEWLLEKELVQFDVEAFGRAFVANQLDLILLAKRRFGFNITEVSLPLSL